MIAKVYSAIPCGYDGQIVEVEGDINQGLPSFNLVGMANKTVNEARERVRSAITNSGFRFPTKKVTVNLAPAELVKDGSHLDLPIALAVLIVSGQLLPGDVADRIFVGELSLSGASKPIRGIINIVEAAKQAGYQEVFLPRDNLPQASLVKGIKLIGIESLEELFLHLKGQKFIQPTKSAHSTESDQPTEFTHSAKSTHPTKSAHSTVRVSTSNKSSAADSPVNNSKAATDSSPTPYILDNICGQLTAKRALTIAIAGHHNILLSGPPGAGKSLLAHTAVNLLPNPTPEEQVEIAKINSLVSPTQSFPVQRPFRAPHHTASMTAIIGGGTSITPGEISLAHQGVLFLDEFPEFARNVIESLRQPLEDHQITLSRTNAHVVYPANFILFAAMNPCPCGFYGDPVHECTCTPRQLQLYATRVSGPILDRIDLHIDVQRVPSNQLLTAATNDKEHRTAKTKIRQAITREQKRYRSLKQPHIPYNGTLTSIEVKKFIQLTSEAENLLKTATDRLGLSARAYFSTIKVAQTIADLDNSPNVNVAQISEALSYRQRSPF